MVFIYIYTLNKQRWHFSLRESKAHIAMDIFIFIKKTLMKEYVQASSILNFNLLFLQKCVINYDTVYTSN